MTEQAERDRVRLLELQGRDPKSLTRDEREEEEELAAELQTLVADGHALWKVTHARHHKDFVSQFLRSLK